MTTRLKARPLIRAGGPFLFDARFLDFGHASPVPVREPHGGCRRRCRADDRVVPRPGLPAPQRFTVRGDRLLSGGRCPDGGEAREYTRLTDEANAFTSGFCPTCGSTVYA